MHWAGEAAIIGRHLFRRGWISGTFTIHVRSKKNMQKDCNDIMHECSTRSVAWPIHQAGNWHHLGLSEWPLSYRYGNVLDYSRPKGKEDAPLNLNKTTAYQEPSRTASAKQHYLRQSRYLPGNSNNLPTVTQTWAGTTVYYSKIIHSGSPGRDLCSTADLHVSALSLPPTAYNNMFPWSM